MRRGFSDPGILRLSPGESDPKTGKPKAFTVTQLTRLIKNQIESNFGSVWVEGEPGVGKSYLLDHFRTALLAADRRWLQVRCSPETQQVALHPVLHLVREQLGLLDLDPEAALVRLEQQLDRLGLDAASTTPLLCPWLQLPLKDPRVQANPAYLTVIVLSRVIVRLGALPDVNTKVIEGLFASDLSYLQALYERINGDEDAAADGAVPFGRAPREFGVMGEA